ncbi:MAG: preprotein translocase subunit SecE [Actinomycetota bacterium]|nr:preprotein translocase subunit SecE [Actinomycetota bacterium]
MQAAYSSSRDALSHRRPSVARNRKKAKERRARRPAQVATQRSMGEPEAPDPIQHATPDVELAEVQVAVGRPEPSEEPEADDEFDEQALEADALDDGSGGDSGDAGDFNGGRSGGGGGELAVPAPGIPEARRRPGSRLINFLHGSWNELQRVQWPDRRQVLQATGVVIGFVIVAGVFLGVADALAAQLVKYIIGGK